MIKFFRIIRQQLLTQNKTGKYLLYAVGEIVLVVIGILIALKLSNINTERANRSKELTLLSEMKQNLLIDQADLESNIRDNSLKKRSNQMVLNHLEGKQVNSDSLSIFYANVLGGSVFVKNTSAFDNLKSLGFDLISSDTLRQQITRLYSENYTYLQHLEVEVHKNVQFNHVYPLVTSRIVNSNLEESAHPLDYESLRNDNQFKETLRQNTSGTGYIISFQRNLKTSIMALMSAIDEEVRRD